MWSIGFLYLVGVFVLVYVSRFFLTKILEPFLTNTKIFLNPLPGNKKTQVNEALNEIIYSEEDFINFEKKVKTLWKFKGDLLKYREEDIWNFGDIDKLYHQIHQTAEDEYNSLSQEERIYIDFDNFKRDWFASRGYDDGLENIYKFRELKKIEFEKKALSHAKPLESDQEFIIFYEKWGDGYANIVGEYIDARNLIYVPEHEYFLRSYSSEPPTATEKFIRMEKYMFTEKDKSLLKSLTYFYGKVYKWKFDDVETFSTEISDNHFERLLDGDPRIATAFKKLKKSLNLSQ